MIWREPAEESDDLYPGLVVHDGRVSGSITVNRSRLPIWTFAGWTWDEIVAGWPYITDEYGWTEEKHREFHHCLFEMRGEFARLLLVLADVERQEQDRHDAELESYGPVVRMELEPGDGGAPWPAPWYEHPESIRRVSDQLRRCLAALEQP